MDTETQPTTPSTADAQSLAEMILHVQRYFLVDLARELSSSQVSFVQFFLLGHLDNDNALTMSEIARRMGHSTAAATGLVDRLEKLGYVQRTHSREDRRKVLVQITRKGARLVDQIRSRVVDSVQDLMLQLGEDEKRTWVEVYQKVFSYCRHP
jgi:DNA-binding MarR family transcriptional regulator